MAPSSAVVSWVSASADAAAGAGDATSTNSSSADEAPPPPGLRGVFGLLIDALGRLRLLGCPVRAVVWRAVVWPFLPARLDAATVPAAEGLPTGSFCNFPGGRLAFFGNVRSAGWASVRSALGDVSTIAVEPSGRCSDAVDAQTKFKSALRAYNLKRSSPETSQLKAAVSCSCCCCCSACTVACAAISAHRVTVCVAQQPE